MASCDFKVTKHYILYLTEAEVHYLQNTLRVKDTEHAVAILRALNNAKQLIEKEFPGETH